jgi:hypothetical protein
MKAQFCKAMVDEELRNQLIKRHIKIRIGYIAFCAIIVIGFTYEVIDRNNISIASIFALFMLFWFSQNENDLKILKKMAKKQNQD